jgi:hypothetical protein
MHRLQFRFYVLFLFFVLNGNYFLRAQNNTVIFSKKEMRRSPVWIAMMNDPQANYFETIRAFREFWKDRVLPKEPFDEGFDVFEREVGLITENETEIEREREEKNASPKKRAESNFYAADVRAFKGWMQDVKPWVRTDGSIVSQQERESIIQQQINEQREQERKQQK